METVTQAEREAKQKVKLWAVDHHGIFAKIARECGVTLKYVAMVAYGERCSSTGKIERALGRAGAPGFQRAKRSSVRAN